MKRLTITLDEETATWLRMYAAASNASVSRIVRAMVAQQMNADRDYMQAMLRYGIA